MSYAGSQGKFAKMEGRLKDRYKDRSGHSDDVDIMAGQDIPAEPCPSCGKSDWISDFDKFNHEAGCIRYR